MIDTKKYIKIFRDKYHRENRTFDMLQLREDLIADGYTKHKATRLAKQIAEKALRFGTSVTVRLDDPDNVEFRPCYGNILPSERMFG